MAIGRGTAATIAASTPPAWPSNARCWRFSIDGAKGVLFNITGGEDLGILEVHEAADVIQQAADPEANIIFGAVIDPNMGKDVKSR